MKDAHAATSQEELNNGFRLNSSDAAMSRLLSKAEPVETNGSDRHLTSYTTRISKYSIQFQGCHTIKHYNKDAVDDDDVRISTKRLVRFRLVPFNKCDVYNPWTDASTIQKAKSLLGKADYGDYIVDMSAFVEAYLQTKQGDDDSVYYGGRRLSDDAVADDAVAANGDDAYNAFDISDYTQCAAFNFGSDDDSQYYLGPYCADQGGEIKLNLFTDDSCTIQAKCNGGATRGANCYTDSTGMTIPYTSESIVDDPCVPCSENYSYLQSAPEGEIDMTSYDFGYAREACSTLYDLSGKCEQYMKNGKYDNGCSYMKGVKIGMSSEGYATGVKRSLGADVAMGALAIMVTFLGMYIYYLRYALKKVDSKHYRKDFYVSSRLS